MAVRQSWHATGLVAQAWKRISPPGRDELARRMGVAGSDLSARNTSTDEKPRVMTLDYAERIVAAVRQDDPSFSLADLGAPTSTVAEADPTVLDRLEELAAGVGALSVKVDLALDHIAKRLLYLEKQSAHRATPARATSQRKRKAG